MYSSNNILNYIHVHKNAMPEYLINEWCETASSPNWTRHVWNHPATNPKDDYMHSNQHDPEVLFAHENGMDPESVFETRSLIMKTMRSYYPEVEIQGLSDIRANRYSVGESLDNHFDHIRTAFDGTRRGIPILSASVNLNDDYTGGEFNFYQYNYKVELGRGDILVFPSVFLYGHGVLPITSGTRYSLVAWGY